jgi:hypothetical protein
MNLIRYEPEAYTTAVFLISLGLNGAQRNIVRDSVKAIPLFIEMSCGIRGEELTR